MCSIVGLFVYFDSIWHYFKQNLEVQLVNYISHALSLMNPEKCGLIYDSLI